MDRLQDGAWVPRAVGTDVDLLVRDVVGDLALPAGRVEVDVPAGLRWTVDGPWLERIVVNLVSNGVRHTAPDDIVWVRVRVVDDLLQVVVEDDGPGIAAEDLARILSAYERLDDATPGSGLGLAIVTRFTALLGGKLTVDERPGGGARFTVSIPEGPGGTGATDGTATVR